MLDKEFVATVVSDTTKSGKQISNKDLESLLSGGRELEGELVGLPTLKELIKDIISTPTAELPKTVYFVDVPFLNRVSIHNRKVAEMLVKSLSIVFQNVKLIAYYRNRRR